MNDENTSVEQLHDLFAELTDFSSWESAKGESGAKKRTYEARKAEAMLKELRESIEENGSGWADIGWQIKTELSTKDIQKRREFERLASELLEARIESAKNGQSEDLKRLIKIAKESLEEFTTEKVAPAPVLAPVVPASPVLTLKEAWEGFTQFKKDWNAERQKTNQMRYEFMVAKWGEDLDVTKIDRRMVKELLKDYADMPLGNLKPYNKMTVAERANLDVDEIREDEFISSKVVKELLKVLQSFLSTYLTNEMEVFSTAPTANVKVDVEKNRWGVYTDTELKQFEKAALSEKDPWRKWGVLLGMYSGMRASEAMRVLAKGHLVSEGIAYFKITEGKTEAANRNVPIHSKLIEYGLLEAGPIKFPSETARPLTKHMNGLRDKLGIPLRDVNDNKRIFHSFRHTLISKIRLDESSNDLLVKRLVGHRLNGGITDSTPMKLA